MRAVRPERAKESGLRQLIASGLSNLLQPCLFWLYLKRLDWLVWRQVHWEKKMRSQHCSKGFHLLQRKTLEVGYMHCKWKVEYLECCICNYKFFAIAKDKRKYLILTSSHRNAIKRMFGAKRRKKNV